MDLVPKNFGWECLVFFWGLNDMFFWLLEAISALVILQMIKSNGNFSTTNCINLCS
jgi:hypothetical protein